ncbi:MAG TPA: flagellar biosynthesis protein FlhA [Opitutaceae bacterium]|nr:flagellar biosynthesis protein FlhA [Opitutaceae bacterium]
MAAASASTSIPLPALGGIRRSDLAFTIALFGVVLMLILPLPAFLLDALLAVSIGISLLILLLITYVKEPAEFSVFPTLLLGITLFRLALNITSTRLILIDGYAGHIIDSFGKFVVQGNYVVGTVVFAILVIINFVVITKGAGRIAEVAARFTLDALPGKQMAIDAELNAGIIDETVAMERRKKLQKETDFYGSMDGANKFVRGDAIAGILITFINIIGGFAIGVLQMDLSFADAAKKFTLLSIGDGLVSQIPALLVSVAAGILVTRAADNETLGVQVTNQLTRYPRAMAIGSAMLGVFGLLPGMPLVPFLGLAGLGGYFAMKLHKQHSAAEAAAKAAPVGGAARPGAKGGAGAAAGGEAARGGPARAASDEEMARAIDLDVFAIEIGYGLLPLADEKKGGDLLQRITGLRRSVSREKGVMVPPISVRDNLELDANDYRFLLRGKPVARGQVMPGRWLAMNVNGSNIRLKGIPTREPVFGLEASWIANDEKTTAEVNGFTVVDPSSVLITHLSETLKNNIWLILGRQDVQQLVDHVKEKHPALVTELIPDLANLGLIQRVLQNLLREGINVLNLPVILEGIADYASVTKNADELAELVRRRLGLYFVSEFEAVPGKVRALTLDPRLEQWLSGRVQRTPTETGLALDPGTAQHLLDELSRRSGEMTQQGLPAVLVVGAETRLAIKRFFESSLPRLAVLSFQELPASAEVENVGLIPLPPHLARMEPLRGGQQQQQPQPAMAA